jgi:hypothetical protein
MRNKVVMDELILFHKPNKNSEEWEDDGLAHSSNQTPYKLVSYMFPNRGIPRRESGIGSLLPSLLPSMHRPEPSEEKA